ncbi:MAG: alpha-2-macroglobulin family protein, partial [Planctomycetota bacterium]
AMADRKTDSIEEAAPAQDDAPIQPTVRSDFVDAAYWSAATRLDAAGGARIAFPAPDNLTTWQVRAWVIDEQGAVGQAAASVVVNKDFLVRLHLPRFLVAGDRATVSANVHNRLDAAVETTVRLTVAGTGLRLAGPTEQTVTIPADDEQRIDWPVHAEQAGTAAVRVDALSAQGSDAMELELPIRIHGAQRVQSFSRALRPDENETTIAFTVAEERLAGRSEVSLRWSPSLLGPVIEALPYLANYPHGCTEQTLNRFLPTLVVHKLITDHDIDLAAQMNQEAEDVAREGQQERLTALWQRWDHNPIYDPATIERMVAAGIERLEQMQLADGGWGWFAGSGARASAHTTAVVLEGLLAARAAGAAVPPAMLQGGIEWLRDHQTKQEDLLDRGEQDEPKQPFRDTATNRDALVFAVLAHAGVHAPGMENHLYRDRNELSVYGKALFGRALHRLEDPQRTAMLRRNVEQYLQRDVETQTAWLALPNERFWWYWYGSQHEAQAAYLELLNAVDPDSPIAAELARYLLINRTHGSRWHSTRDTAYCIRALVRHFAHSSAAQADYTLELHYDDTVVKTVRVTAQNVLTASGAWSLTGADVTGGAHTLSLHKRGRGPVYVDASVAVFTTAEHIEAAGLQITIARNYYRLEDDPDATALVPTQRGEARRQTVGGYRRIPIAHPGEATSGDLIEVELVLESRNDYEYLVLTDPRPAGCEAAALRSGYRDNGGLRRYQELRDEAAICYIRRLPRGKHSLSYRLRCQVPGDFSALPTQIEAMYAPRLRGNSEELRLEITDRSPTDP